ncbi:hypothetical protein QTO34_016862 [Cnephaeus nilssonii]|uniref:A-kinase anchor protein 11 n=1 Tax=Cnephaeus nilssonii TaxID=3371016 RepID=A0AA40I305_CNENI|nr:hypothetical protein QTO34_016862 [Eptesicus nilssonii]
MAAAQLSRAAQGSGVLWINSSFITYSSNIVMATFQTFRNSRMKTRASVRKSGRERERQRETHQLVASCMSPNQGLGWEEPATKSFSEDVFQSVKSLLQSEKELCNISAEDCLKQDEHTSLTEVTFLGFNEETDAAHIQDLAAVSLELPDLLNSLHFCSLNENEIICMKDINKSPNINNGPLNQSRHSGMLCVMRVSPPTLPRLRIDFIFGLLSKYATGIRYTLDTYLHQKRQLETTNEDDDDTNQSVSSIEDDFVTAFEHLEEEETLKPYNDGVNVTALKSHCDAASQTTSGHQLETHDLRILVSSGRQKSLAKPSTSLINVLGRKEQPGKSLVTTSISEPWIQRSFYRSSNASDKGHDMQKTFFSSSPAYSSESECSSPSPVIFLDEEGYQKSLKAKLELPKIPVMKDDIEDSDSEVSEFFDSFDQFDELEQTLETSCPFLKDSVKEKILQKKGHKHDKSSVTTTMNPQKFKFDCPALPANVRKPTPRKPESPYSNLSDAPDSPRPVKASGEDSGLFSPIRSSAFSPLGGCTPAECFCQTDIGGDRIHENHDSIYYTYEDYANRITCEVLGSVLHTQHTNAISNINSVKKGENETIALKSGNLDQNKSKNKPLMIRDSIQKFAADLVEKSFGSAFKDLQKGVSSCTNALCHLAIKLTSSVFQMAFNELRRQRAFSLKERAISGLANFLVSEALSNALKDLQYVKKQIFTNIVAGFAADLAEELIFEGIMEVCQFSSPPTPASPKYSFDYEDKVVKSYAKDLSESVMQEAFIELSQVDVIFTTKAAVSVSTDNIKYVSAENIVPWTQTSTCPIFNSQAIVAKPMPEYKYTVQQALFCTSGIVTSIPVPLAGSALLPYHFSSNIYQAKTHLSSGDSNLNGDSTEAGVSTKNNEEEVACLRNICLPSEHSLGNQNDFKPTNNDVEVQSSSKLTSDPVIISNFSTALVHSIVNETLESVTSFKVTKTVDEHTDCLTKTVKGKNPPFHNDQVTLQQSEASNKDMFVDRLSKSVIKHSIEKSKSVISNVDKNMVNREGLPVAGEESQLIWEKFPRSLDAQDHLTHCSLLVGKDCVPECKDSIAHGFSLEPLPCCSTMAGQKPDLKEAAKDTLVKKYNLNNMAPVPLSFGQESPSPHSHTFSSAVLTYVDGLHVEDKQKIRDGNVIPDTPPSTPLVPSQASSEWDIKKLTKKLKGELAKEFAPATPPSTPHYSSVGSLSENEQNTIEKEEFMLKLMRSLSEEVESSEGEEHPEVDMKAEHSEKKAQFAEALASHIISLATEMAASHLDNKIIQEPKIKSPCLNVQSQRSVSPTLLNHADENLQALCNFAGDMAAEVITEAEKIAKVRSCMLSRQKKSSYSDGDQDHRTEEKLNIEMVAHPREVDPFILSLPPSSCMSGLSYKYPSCESVTDEYAGHIIQILKQEGGNSELIMDQYANRLAYRSVKSGLKEAAKTATMKCNSKMFLLQNSQVKANNELLMFLNKHHQEVEKKDKILPQCRQLKCVCQACRYCDEKELHDCMELDRMVARIRVKLDHNIKRELVFLVVAVRGSRALFCFTQRKGGGGDSRSPKETEDFQSTESFVPVHEICAWVGSLKGNGYHLLKHIISEYFHYFIGDNIILSEISQIFNMDKCRFSTKKNRHCYFLRTGLCKVEERKEEGRKLSCSPSFFGSGTCRRQPIGGSLSSLICSRFRIFGPDYQCSRVNMDILNLVLKLVFAKYRKMSRSLKLTATLEQSWISGFKASFFISLILVFCRAAGGGVGHLPWEGRKAVLHSHTYTIGYGCLFVNYFITNWLLEGSNLALFLDPVHEIPIFDNMGEAILWCPGSGDRLILGCHGREHSSYFIERDIDGPRFDSGQGHSVESLGQDGKTLLITNIDMEPCTVDPQLRIILQWLVASEAEVAELSFHDSAKKEFIQLSKQLQEKGWKVGDLLQAVLNYYEVVEKTSSEEKCKSLYDWLLENA